MHDLLQSILNDTDSTATGSCGVLQVVSVPQAGHSYFHLMFPVTQLNDIIRGRAVRAFGLLLCTAMADVHMCESQIRIPFIMTFNTLLDTRCQSHHHPEERM